jgi:hypothetical protein
MNSKGSILLITVLIVGLIATVYLTFNYVGLDGNKNDNNTTISPTLTDSIPTTKPTYSSPTLAISESVKTPTPTSSENCPAGFQFYDEEYFSFCYPNNLSFKDRRVSELSGGTQSITVRFENNLEQPVLTIITDFVGGWVPDSCDVSENVQVSGYEAVRHNIQENENGNCMPQNSYVTLINLSNGRVFYVASSLDLADYISAEQSLEIKVP